MDTPPPIPPPPPPPAPPPPAEPTVLPPLLGGVDGPASTRATLSLALGIVGIVGHVSSCCCCIFWGLGLICSPLAWIFGHQELQDIAAGRAPRAGKGSAEAGRALGIIGTALIALSILGTIIWIAVAGFGAVFETLTRRPRF